MIMLNYIFAIGARNVYAFGYLRKHAVLINCRFELQ